MTLVIKAIVLVVVVVVLLIVITWAGGKKAKDLLTLVQEGAKLEFTEKPGYVSAFTVVVLVGFTWAVVAIHEVKDLLGSLFRMGSDSGPNALLIGMVAVILALVLNFVFIFAMRGRSR